MTAKGTVRRWLERWVASGVLVDGKKRIVLGSDKPVPSHTLPPSHARALSINECNFQFAPRERLQEQEKGNGISDSSAEGAISFFDEPPVPESKLQAPESGTDAICNSSVPESDYKEQIANCTSGDISRARARQR
jgi:hypothetical protein